MTSLLSRREQWSWSDNEPGTRQFIWKTRSVFSIRYKGRTNACIQVLPFVLCVKSRRDFHINCRSIRRQQMIIEIAAFQAISIIGVDGAKTCSCFFVCVGVYSYSVSGFLLIFFKWLYLSYHENPWYVMCVVILLLPFGNEHMKCVYRGLLICLLCGGIGYLQGFYMAAEKMFLKIPMSETR